MKLKKVLSLALVGMMVFSGTVFAEETEGVPKYSEIVLGEDYLDLTAEVEFFHNRTDYSADGYMTELIAEFNEMYPNITIIESSTTDYVNDYNMRLSSGEWTGIMLECGGDYSIWPDLFHPIDDLENLEDSIRWVGSDSYEGTVYAIPFQASPGTGVVYNKRVWEEAGITETPKTTEEFMTCLQMIKDNTDAIPLYTCYMDDSSMGAYGKMIGVSGTGDVTYLNQKFAKAENPFSEGNAIYDTLKVYYDAVANGLTEEDYTATDWEASKAMINSGEAASIIIPAWYLAQAQSAGETPEDVAYMIFPYTAADGKQYTQATVSRGCAINKNDTDEVKTAAVIFTKWLAEESDFAIHAGTIPSPMSTDMAAAALELGFDLGDAEMLVEENALSGEESLYSDMKEESTLLIGSGSIPRGIIEAAASGSRSFDEIIDEMNELWSDAQEALGITPEY